MIRLAYNPFQKDFDKLTPADLAVLTQVAEGWYVEYKGTAVPAKSIAKSLAAFANHYGGWIFYGVEGSKGDNVASAFPGLAPDQTKLLVENIRNAAKDSINPSPYYEYRELKGPCTEIGLPADQSIVVVAVPEGINTPFVHRDGRIYRRIADASDPKEENDRFILDQLWERKRRIENELADLLEQEPEVSQGEGDEIIMSIFLLTDPLMSKHHQSKLSFEKFVEVMSSSNQDKEKFSLIFDNFFTSADGFIARLVANNNPLGITLTWRHLSNGTSIITIPIQKHYIDQYEISKGLRKYKHIEEFFTLPSTKRHETLTIIDVQMVIALLVTTLSRHTILMSLGDINGSVYAKVSFNNIWRKTPYLDTSKFISFVSKCGIPIIQNDSHLVPTGTTFDSLLLLEPEDSYKNEDPAVRQLARAFNLIAAVASAFGIPNNIIYEKRGGWLLAMFRALDASVQGVDEDDEDDDEEEEDENEE